MKKIDSAKVVKVTTYERRFTRAQVLAALGVPAASTLRELGGDCEGDFTVTYKRVEEVDGFE